MTLRSFGDWCVYVLLVFAAVTMGYGLADVDILKVGIASFIMVICSTILTRRPD